MSDLDPDRKKKFEDALKSFRALEADLKKQKSWQEGDSLSWNTEIATTETLAELYTCLDLNLYEPQLLGILILFESTRTSTAWNLVANAFKTIAVKDVKDKRLLDYVNAFNFLQIPEFLATTVSQWNEKKIKALFSFPQRLGPRFAMPWNFNILAYLLNDQKLVEADEIGEITIPKGKELSLLTSSNIPTFVKRLYSLTAQPKEVAFCQTSADNYKLVAAVKIGYKLMDPVQDDDAALVDADESYLPDVETLIYNLGVISIMDENDPKRVTALFAKIQETKKITVENTYNASLISLFLDVYINHKKLQPAVSLDSTPYKALLPFLTLPKASTKANKAAGAPKDQPSKERGEEEFPSEKTAKKEPAAKEGPSKKTIQEVQKPLFESKKPSFSQKDLSDLAKQRLKLLKDKSSASKDGDRKKSKKVAAAEKHAASEEYTPQGEQRAGSGAEENEEAEEAERLREAGEEEEQEEEAEEAEEAEEPRETPKGKGKTPQKEPSSTPDKKVKLPSTPQSPGISAKEYEAKIAILKQENGQLRRNLADLNMKLHRRFDRSNAGETVFGKMAVYVDDHKKHGTLGDAVECLQDVHSAFKTHGYTGWLSLLTDMNHNIDAQTDLYKALCSALVRTLPHDFDSFKKVAQTVVKRDQVENLGRQLLTYPK